MFDRLFNILRANLGNSTDADQGLNYRNIDEEYERYFKTEKQQPSQDFNFNYGHHNTTPLFSKEELEHYAALELKPGAAFPEIKAAYKSLMKKYHPDRFHNDPAKHKSALELAQKLNKAYDFFERKFNK